MLLELQMILKKKHHDVTSCQLYDKHCETTTINEPKNVNQDKKTRLNKIQEKIDNAPDNNFHLVEYIK